MQPGEKLAESSQQNGLETSSNPPSFRLGRGFSHIPRHTQGSITAGVMATANPDSDSQASALEPFQTHSSTADNAWKPGFRERWIRLPALHMGRNKTQTQVIPCQLSSERSEPGQGKDIHWHFRRRDFYAKVSWDLPSLHFFSQGCWPGCSSGFVQSGLPHAPTLCAGLAAHLLFTVLPLLSQAPLAPKVSQLCIHTDDKNTTSYRTGRALSRSDSQGDKWQCYHTRTREHTHSHNRDSGLSGLQETSSAGSAQDRGAPCASLHTCRPQWGYHHWGVCALGPSISVAVLQTTPIS